MPTPSLTLIEIGHCKEPGHDSWSPYCVKAQRALHLAGLAYERRILTLPSQAKKYNPTGQFPSLLVDGKSYPDSSAILHKVNELSGGRLTQGLEGAALAQAWIWEEFGDSVVNSFLLASRWADDENWPRAREAILSDFPRIVRVLLGPRFRKGIINALIQRDIWRAGPEACWKRFSELLDHLDALAPATGFWMGEHLTVADLGLFPQLHGLLSHISPRQAAELSRRKRLSAWLDRVQAATVSPTATG
jgi:glutathione S-transferase